MSLNLGVLASGRGSNFQALVQAVEQGRLDARIRVLVSNTPEAGALQFARSQGIPAEVVRRSDFSDRRQFIEAFQRVLISSGVDFVALAGYMKRIPPEIVRLFPSRILNIHPALLPSFGGPGMYGRRVHEAVLDRGCKVSGVTVHLVDEKYDNGPVVAQQCVPVLQDDTADTLAARVLQEEHRLYAAVLQWFAQGRVQVQNGSVRILPEPA